jgi:adenylate cyclase
MTHELSAKDKKLKERLERELLGGELSLEGRFRRVFGLLPSEPRCASCLAPFDGVGGAFVKLAFNKQRSVMNPLMCNLCEEVIKKLRYGAEVEMSMLFADIRGSTPMAESMSPVEFRQLIDRFYTETTHVLMHSYAMIDKLVGDEVSGFYIPSIAGKDYAQKSVRAAQELLRVTGHEDKDGPWAPVGVGIHTGEAYFGAVGSGESMVDITALGDAVNLASRLASQAAVGEVIISESTARQAEIDTSVLEKRQLTLKGKSEPMDVSVMHVMPNKSTKAK